MSLVLFLEFTTTFRTLPQGNSLLPFHYRCFDAVTGLLSNLGSYILPYDDYVADRTTRFFIPILTTLPPCGSPSKLAWTLNPAPAKFLP